MPLCWALAFGHTASWAQAPAALPSVWDGVYTDDQAKRGATVYTDECSKCHGPTLEGDGEEATPLAGGGFLSNWNGKTVGDIFDRIRKTMPDKDPGKLTRQQDADVLAYLLNFNGFPSGKTELSTEVERLKLIKFDAIKK